MYLKKLYRQLNSGQDLAAFHVAVVRTIIVQVCTLLVTTAVSIVISRELGVEGRGITSWIIGFASLGSVFSILGMGPVSRKYIARTPQDLSVFALLNVLLLIGSLLILLPLFYYYGSRYSVAQHDHVAFFAGIFLIPLFALSSICNDMVIGIGRTLHSNILLMVEKGMNAFLNIGLILLGMVFPVAVILSYIVALLIRIGLNLHYLRPHINRMPSFKDIRSRLAQVRVFLLSSYVTSIASYYSGMFLILMLGVLSSTKELGYFAVAKLIIDNVMALAWSFASFTLPQLAKQTSAESYERTKWHIVILILLMTGTLALPLFIFSLDIIRLLFGDSFAEAGDCLRIIVPGMVAASILSAFNAIIASQSKEYLSMLAPVVTALVMSILVWYFRSELDAITAAYIYNVAFIAGLAVAVAPMALARFSPTTYKKES